RWCARDTEHTRRLGSPTGRVLGDWERMQVGMALGSVAVLFGTAVLGIVFQSASYATRLIYGTCLAACLVTLLAASAHLLLDPGSSRTLQLPVGLPWSGAHFTLDALSAFFLVVVNLGGAGASLFAIGYGEHERAPGRVLPFYPVFLAGMNLVVLAA